MNSILGASVENKEACFHMYEMYNFLILANLA